MQIRNRIRGHRKVRAGDLVPHELNYRFHPERQRAALGALYREIGFARSLLAYELPGGKLKLIDGHLRRDMDPDMEVDVEVLDLTEEEARVLLLSIDPLADLALVQDQIRERLMDLTPTDCTDLAALWKEAQETIDSALEENSKKDRSPSCELDQRFKALPRRRSPRRPSQSPGCATTTKNSGQGSSNGLDPQISQITQIKSNRSQVFLHVFLIGVICEICGFF